MRAEQLRQIVVHPGGAHKDDFLAVCLLLADNCVPVERRDPTAAELDDPTVAVVDIGGSFDPARQNFDHHQFPREHAPTCSLSLVLQGWGIYDDARALFDWLPTLEWFDSRGPQRTAEWLGVEREALTRLNSPLDVVLLRLFSASPRWVPGDAVHQVMSSVGREILAFLRGAGERRRYLERRVQFWDLPLGEEVGMVAFLPREESVPDEPSEGMARYVVSCGHGAKVVALAYPDQRASGYGLARFQDHPRVDFCRVEQEEDVHFAHKSGFLCKTSATDPERLRTLIQQAWR